MDPGLVLLGGKSGFTRNLACALRCASIGLACSNIRRDAQGAAHIAAAILQLLEGTFIHRRSRRSSRRSCQHRITHDVWPLCRPSLLATGGEALPIGAGKVSSSWTPGNHSAGFLTCIQTGCDVSSNTLRLPPAHVASAPLVRTTNRRQHAREMDPYGSAIRFVVFSRGQYSMSQREIVRTLMARPHASRDLTLGGS